jgi:hypothetical protein
VNDFVPWPKDWPRVPYRPCYCPDCSHDMLIGPCACGAYHKPGDFRLAGGLVYAGEELEAEEAKYGPLPSIKPGTDYPA